MKEKIIEILEWYSAVVGTQRYNDAIPDIADEIVALIAWSRKAKAIWSYGYDEGYREAWGRHIQSVGDEVI